MTDNLVVTLFLLNNERGTEEEQRGGKEHNAQHKMPQAARNVAASPFILNEQAKSDNALNRLPRIKTKVR